jgi:hypothetical protein
MKDISDKYRPYSSPVWNPSHRHTAAGYRVYNRISNRVCFGKIVDPSKPIFLYLQFSYQ